MVLNLWKNTKPICANHLPEKIEMVFDATGKQMVYKCPTCGLNITSNDFEKILNQISKIYVKRSSLEEWGSLVGEKFPVGKFIRCEIIEHSDDEKYEISIRNIRNGG